MKKLHLVVGILSLIAFVLTGQYLKRVYPGMPGMDDGMRMMLRSRHLYIMLAGAVNTGLGLYLVDAGGGWRRTLQRIGSVLIAVAPAVLIAAFFIEPGRGGAGARIGPPGLIAIFGGMVLHLISNARLRRKVV